MTIRQQGGVFGRNPKFNDVEVDGTLTTDNFTLDGTPVTATGAELNYLDIATLGRGEASKAVTADASGNVFLGNKTALSDVNAGHAFAQGGNSGLGYSARDGLIHSYNQLGSGGQTIRFLYQGSAAGYIDVYNTYATFRPSNGGGIDFSATSGTGTSELFDDYEEGTWTPAYDTTDGNLSVTHDQQNGSYVKIGRLVHVSGYIRTDAITGGSGNVLLTGLPYTVSTGFGFFSALSVASQSAWTNPPHTGRTDLNANSVALIKSDLQTAVVYADLATGANDNDLRFSLTYQTY